MSNAAIISQKIAKPHLEVEGSSLLSGTLSVNGAKNSALVLMAASLLTQDELVLTNVPQLTDIQGMSEILIEMGATLKSFQNTLRIKASDLRHVELPYELVHELRASFFCIGPLLARLGQAKIPLPGGCEIGARPVSEHIKGLKALGAYINVEHGVVTASLPGIKSRLKAADIVLDCPSVGATETILMAAVLADGQSSIENAAQEPEVQDLFR